MKGYWIEINDILFYQVYTVNLMLNKHAIKSIFVCVCVMHLAYTCRMQYRYTFIVTLIYDHIIMMMVVICMNAYWILSTKHIHFYLWCFVHEHQEYRFVSDMRWVFKGMTTLCLASFSLKQRTCPYTFSYY